MKSPAWKQFTIIALVVAVGVMLFGMMLGPRKNRIDTTLATAVPVEKQLAESQVLESLDRNSRVPQFKLSLFVHEMNGQMPKELLLVDRVTGVSAFRLNLNESHNTEECMFHKDINVDMQMRKWDTQWFVIPGIDSVDATYTPKLSDKFTVKVEYADGPDQTTFISRNMISEVCFQTPDSTTDTTPSGDYNAE